jgi:chlorite dismutase
MTEKTINHFMYLKFTQAFWEMPSDKRANFFPAFAKESQEAVPCSNLYQVSPLNDKSDFLMWSAAPLQNEKDEVGFFESLAQVVNSRRQLLQPVVNIWGYTRPSMYAHNPSSQEIDPFDGQRQTYLVLYPFVKTIGWYLLGKDMRQGMMNEHIRIGHQYPEIKQLLLYSFGVQDQEFVVVYETEHLYRFSELVNELRGTDVRLYTERDTPVFAAIRRSPEALGAIFNGR